MMAYSTLQENGSLFFLNKQVMIEQNGFKS